MGVLAIKDMNIEGQVGNAAITRAAFSLAAGVDFATELDCKLSNSPAGNKPTPNPGQAARVSSDNATSVCPETALTFAKGSAHLEDEAGAGTANPRAGTTGEKCVPARAALQNEAPGKPSLDAGILSGDAAQVPGSSPKTMAAQDSKALSANKGVSVQDISISPPSRPALAVEAGQDRSSFLMGPVLTPARHEALQATSPSSLGKGLQSAGAETHAPLQNVTTQLQPRGPSSAAEARARQRAESGSESESGAYAATGPNARISTPSKQARDLSLSIASELTKAVPTSARTEASQAREPKASSGNRAASAEDGSTPQPSRSAQDVVRGQEGSAPVTGSAPTSTGTEATSPSSLGKGLQGGGAETHAPLQNVTTQFQQQDPSSAHEATGRQQARDLSQSVPFELTKAVSTSPGTQVSQAKGPTAVLAETSSTPQPSRPVQDVIRGQEGSGPVTGSAPTSKGTEATSPSSLGKGLQGAGVETHAPLQNVTTQFQQQVPSSGPEARARQAVQSGPGSQSNAHDAIALKPQVSTQGQPSRDFSQSIPSELKKAVSTPPRTEASQDQDSIAPSANEAASVEDRSILQLSRAARNVIAGQQASALMTASAPTSERIEATSASTLGKGLQSAAVETLAPLQNETTQMKQQDPSSAPEARARQQAESGPESPSSTHAATGPNAQISTPGQRPPDYLQPVPFELTEAASARQLDEPQNSNRIKNAQEGKQAESGANSDAEPGGPAASLVLQPAETNGIETGSLVNDTKPDNISADKQGGAAAQDLTKVRNEKDGLPKADADLPLAQQLAPQGRAGAGSAFSELAGASRNPGQAGSASVSEGYQANPEGVVSSARFAQQAGNAEMQVRLRSETLGPIDVRTIVKGSDIGASIRVEARDTQVMLANELSQLERALNERSLRVGHLDVLQGSVSGGRSDGTGADNSHGSPSEPRPSFSNYSAGQTSSLPEAPTVTEDWGLGLSSTRINLRV